MITDTIEINGEKYLINTSAYVQVQYYNFFQEELGELIDEFLKYSVKMGQSNLKTDKQQAEAVMNIPTFVKVKAPQFLYTMLKVANPNNRKFETFDTFLQGFNYLDLFIASVEGLHKYMNKSNVQKEPKVQSKKKKRH